MLHEGSPLLIVAGAGSGKTAVLTRRIAYLLAARDVGVGQVLAITFTNKAAAEMRERVVQLVGPRARSMWVSTFHSTCVRILRNQASLLPGLNSNFSIYDADDSRRLLLMIGKDMGLDTKRYSPRLLANGISNLKNELIGPEQAAAEASNAEELARIIAEVFGEYQRRLRAANALDFDDLIGETVAVLQAFPQIAQYYRRRFRHILVDEYQDTNHAQYVLVRELVGTAASQDDEAAVAPAELCVVGDADQSIYAFRGATIRNIEDFERDFPNATTILLEQNYRSTQNILSAATPSSRATAAPREAAVDRRRAKANSSSDMSPTTSTTRRGSSPRRSTRLPTAATSPTTTSRCSTAPTTRHARWKRCSSGPVSRTKSLAAFAFTSARRSATSSPTCGCWTTQATRSACGGS